jgi:hypothetical protein
LVLTASVAPLCAAAAIFWLLNKELMFYIPNVLTYAGFLPASVLMGIKQTIFVDSPVRTQSVITLLSIASFGGLALLVAQNAPPVKKIPEFFHKHVSLAVLLFVAVFTVGAYLIFRSYYDRYLIITLPLLLLFLGLYWQLYKRYLVLGYLLLAGFIVMSVAFEHDYLSLNRTVWEVPQKFNIDRMSYYGTFEYTGYQRLDLFKDVDDMALIEAQEWMPAKDEYDYYISYTTVRGYCVEETINYRSYISPDFTGSLLLLKRDCL